MPTASEAVLSSSFCRLLTLLHRWLRNVYADECNRTRLSVETGEVNAPVNNPGTQPA